MLSRRELLTRTLQTAPLLALGSVAPGLLMRSAWAAAEASPNNDKILVVVELAGGNDSLNMVIPFTDDQYYKLRPTLGIKLENVLRIDDSVGLNVRMQPLEKLLDNQSLAIVQGVGYPNPNRSHFESMDIWHSADPAGRSRAGWLGQATSDMHLAEGQIPAIHLGEGKVPLALQGAAAGVWAINPRNKDFGLKRRIPVFEGHTAITALEVPKPNDQDANQDDIAHKFAKPDEVVAQWFGSLSPSQYVESKRSKLIRELTESSPVKATGLGQFVQRTALDSYVNADKLRDLLSEVHCSRSAGSRTYKAS